MKTPEEIKKGLECHRRLIMGHCDALCSKCQFNAYESGVGASAMRDALAYIQQLEQINADFAERTAQLEAQVPKWISVEERLPEENCVTKGGEGGTYSDLVLVFGRDDLGNLFTCDDIIANGEWINYRAPLFEVTHWMPLPEAPKEG